MEEVVLAAKKYNKALELNNSSFIVRPDSIAQCSQFAKMAKKHNTLICINSDAHICYKVGENTNALSLAVRAGISRSQILNTSTQKIKEFLVYNKQHSKHVAKAQ